jgi:hypothetical protein
VTKIIGGFYQKLDLLCFFREKKFWEFFIKNIGGYATGSWPVKIATRDKSIVLKAIYHIY